LNKFLLLVKLRGEKEGGGEGMEGEGEEGKVGEMTIEERVEGEGGFSFGYAHSQHGYLIHHHLDLE
jgi:hypothetical protein